MPTFAQYMQQHETPEDRAASEARLRRLAWFMDSALQVPRTNYRVGFDGLIGLIPGVGDLTGLLLSSYIVWEGWRMGASRSTVARMMGNVILDAAVGAIPIAGDLFDFAFKANRKNLKLLGLDRPGKVLAEASRDR